LNLFFSPNSQANSLIGAFLILIFAKDCSASIVVNVSIGRHHFINSIISQRVSISAYSSTQAVIKIFVNFSMEKIIANLALLIRQFLSPLLLSC
jgi:hypothetical protein